MWMTQWRNAAHELERVRREELAHTDSRAVAQQIEDACRAAIALNPPQPTSGLILQQRFLHRRVPR